MTAWTDSSDSTAAIRQWEAVQAIERLVTEAGHIAYESGMEAERFIDLVGQTLRPLMTEEGG